MNGMGVTKLEGELRKITTRIGNETPIIIDETEIPIDFMKRKVEETPQKKLIVEALKKGIEIPGIGGITRNATSIIFK